MLANDIAARLKRTPDGLVVAVAQQHDTGEVLMVAWMNDDALAQTRQTFPGEPVSSACAVV